MTFGSTFGRVFSPTFHPKSQAPAVASSWWLAGGIAAANCVAAYQPKGAASYAASKVNLANPGTYDAVKGSANDPSWSTGNGWEFDTTVWMKYTLAETINAGSSTFIMRGSNVTTNRYIFGRGSGFGILYGVVQLGSRELSSGYTGDWTVGMRGDSATGNVYNYLNAAYRNQGAATFSDLVNPAFGINAPQTGAATSAFYCKAVVQYRTTLTQEQIIAVMLAMAAL